ncbi:hypothetical protein ACRALDRAFT_1059616 [Sodiomyces alcalophilus JCM 7366]|uniref:uncharacterized protein n=1 Tax=Sodiomyces alcalophilus JCM 7366 TaxID=591952 RepID=UPI0039B5EF44
MPVTLDHGASIPSRESFHANHEAGQVHRLSYRASSSLSDTPRSVYADEDNYDQDDMLDEYYDDIIGPDAEKSQDSQGAPPPALPNKSTLRNSRLLDAFTTTVALNPQGERTDLTRAAPQDVYLSSEEDASSSADEFSDYDWDSGSERSPGSPSSRHSHEDTAKMVSVVFVGKPSIINLSNNGRRSVPPQPTHKPPVPGVVRSSTEPLPSPRASISSTSTSADATSKSAQRDHPPRLSSRRGTNLLTKQAPPFLSIDPYASRTYDESSPKGRRGDADTPTIARAPSGMLRKGLSIVRKRSRPALREAACRDSISSTLSFQIDRSNTTTPNPVERQSHVDAIKTAQKNPRHSAVVYPPSPGQLLSSGRGRILSSFSKRKSLKP